MHSHINIETAKILTLRAINIYLTSSQGTGDRYGLYHSTKGNTRARRMKVALESTEIMSDNMTFFALLLAIFGEPNIGSFFDFQIGRSSRLASLIADQFIEGEQRHGHLHHTLIPLASNVFSNSLLNQSRLNRNNFRIIHNHYRNAPNRCAWEYFDKTKGVRHILNLALKKESPEIQQIIKNSAKNLKRFLESTSEEKISLSFFPRVEERLRARIDGATIGALQGTMLPEGAQSIIANFLTSKNGAILSTVNKKAYNNAKKTEEKQIYRVINVYK